MEPTQSNAENDVLSLRKLSIRSWADHWAARRESFIRRNQAFYEDDYQYLRFIIPEGASVLEVGCGTGHLLAALKPSRGVGIDLSPNMIELAKTLHPGPDYILADIEGLSIASSLQEKFDFILLHDTIGFLEDCQATFSSLQALCRADTRLVVSYYNYAWEPMLRMADWIGLRMPAPVNNWLKPPDIVNLLSLADYQVVRNDWRQLLPFRLFGVGRFINRFIGTLPGIRKLCLRNYTVARPMKAPREETLSATVVVPCRNEKGNIEAIFRRLPNFSSDLEIIFIEGHSKDGTYEEVERCIPIYPERDVKLMRQDGKGKGDAVFKAFEAARGDVLIILDADLSVPPEDIPKFYDALLSDKGEFINGSRLVYPMQDEAMRFLNRIANHTFSMLFSWLLNQRFTDTLCGTKVLRQRHYVRIKSNRSYFGDFDPFGDFDLIFGACKLNLKITELPVPYAARTYGETQISRFTHGWLLLRMVVFAYFKLKVLK